MIGGNDVATINEIVMPLVTQSFSKKSVYCGKSGSGMAVKSVNNALNTAHLLLATEGFFNRFYIMFTQSKCNYIDYENRSFSIKNVRRRT